MENFITIMAYIIVFGSAAAVAAILAVIAWYVLKKRVSRLWCYFGSLVAVLCILASLCWHPVLFYSQDCAQNLTEEQENAVRSVSEGVYSQRMPLIPVAIRVNMANEDYVAWTEFYFPCGTVEMELYGADGYNCTKYLLPW